MTIAELFATLGATGTWVDPLDDQTVYSDTAGATQAVLDGPVARIDAPTGSPVAASFTNATSGEQPILRADGLEHDGSNDGLGYPDDPALRFGTTDFTIAFACKPTGTGTGRIWDKRGTGAAGANLGWGLRQQGNSLRLMWDSGSSTDFTMAVGVFAAGVPQYGLVEVDRAAGTATARIGGVDFSPVAIPAGDISGTQPLTIGRAAGATTQIFDGVIGRLLVIDKLLSAQDKATVESWLQAEPGAQSAQAPTAWRIRTAAQRPSAWRIFTTTPASTAWRVLGRTARQAQWRIRAATAESVAWRVLTGNAQAVSWRVRSGAARVTAWRILNRIDRLTGWRIGDVVLPPPSVVIYATPRTRGVRAGPYPRVVYATPPTRLIRA